MPIDQSNVVFHDDHLTQCLTELQSKSSGNDEASNTARAIIGALTFNAADREQRDDNGYNHYKFFNAFQMLLANVFGLDNQQYTPATAAITGRLFGHMLNIWMQRYWQIRGYMDYAFSPDFALKCQRLPVQATKESVIEQLQSLRQEARETENDFFALQRQYTADPGVVKFPSKYAEGRNHYATFARNTTAIDDAQKAQASTFIVNLSTAYNTACAQPSHNLDTLKVAVEAASLFPMPPRYPKKRYQRGKTALSSPEKVRMAITTLYFRTLFLTLTTLHQTFEKYASQRFLAQQRAVTEDGREVDKTQYCITCRTHQNRWSEGVTVAATCPKCNRPCCSNCFDPANPPRHQQAKPCPQGHSGSFVVAQSAEAEDDDAATGGYSNPDRLVGDEPTQLVVAASVPGGYMNTLSGVPLGPAFAPSANDGHPGSQTLQCCVPSCSATLNPGDVRCPEHGIGVCTIHYHQMCAEGKQAMLTCQCGRPFLPPRSAKAGHSAETVLQQSHQPQSKPLRRSDQKAREAIEARGDLVLASSVPGGYKMPGTNMRFMPPQQASPEASPVASPTNSGRGSPVLTASASGTTVATAVHVPAQPNACVGCHKVLQPTEIAQRCSHNIMCKKCYKGYSVSMMAQMGLHWCSSCRGSSSSHA